MGYENGGDTRLVNLMKIYVQQVKVKRIFTKSILNGALLQSYLDNRPSDLQ